MKNLLQKFLVGITVIVLFPLFVYGQMMDPVSYTTNDVPDQVKAGQVFKVSIDASIDGDWHLYSVNNDPDAGPFPTKFSAPAADMAIAGDVLESDPVVSIDPNFDAELGWHSKNASFTVPVAFRKSISGRTNFKLKVFYQVCDDKTCLPPKSKFIQGSVDVKGVAAEPFDGFTKSEISKQTDKSKKSTKKFSDQDLSVQDAQTAESSVGGKGILSFLWIALTAGFAALLTPCVFPMIPLTVSFFSKNSGNEKSTGIGQALIFGFSIIITFTTLGALLAFFIGAAGANQFASNPWVNLFIALILLAFAVSLLGAFELQLPHQLTNWLNRKSNESSGVVGVLFMALTISAVSFSCTAPFVGGVLAATTGGQWFYPIVGMVGFSAAFASPFVLFAMFPGWLERLPKSGSWMNTIKVLLGFIELAASIKFLSNVDLVWQWNIISRPFAIAVWIVIFLLAGFYILRFYTIGETSEQSNLIGTGRLMLAIPFLVFSFYLIPGLMGASLGIWDAWLPPKQATDVSVVRSLVPSGTENTENGREIQWSSSFDSAKERAIENNKPIFIDFTGYTCTNCRAMEANVFPLKSVKKQFGKMQLVRLYTDDGTDGPENQRFQFNLTGTVALPTYAILNPENEEVISQLVGYTDAEGFQKFLNSGLQGFQKILETGDSRRN